MVKQFLSLLTILSVFLSILANTPTLRITAGRDAKPGEFPYQVSIQIETSSRFLQQCGGSIISSTWILTAAHCYIGGKFKYRVVAGILKLDDTNAEREERNVVKFIQHPQYTGPFNAFFNDIGLIQLEFPLIFNNLVKPIKLPKAGSEVEGEATLSGWGSTDRIRMIVPKHLQALEISIFPHLVCFIYNWFYSKDTQICGAPLLKGACPGDSGGPLVQNGEVVGIISHGVFLCALIFPDYYIKVSAYIDFIEEHVTV